MSQGVQTVDRRMDHARDTDSTHFDQALDSRSCRRPRQSDKTRQGLEGNSPVHSKSSDQRRVDRVNLQLNLLSPWCVRRLCCTGQAPGESDQRPSTVRSIRTRVTTVRGTTMPQFAESSLHDVVSRSKRSQIIGKPAESVLTATFDECSVSPRSACTPRRPSVSTEFAHQGEQRVDAAEQTSVPRHHAHGRRYRADPEPACCMQQH